MSGQARSAISARAACALLLTAALHSLGCSARGASPTSPEPARGFASPSALPSEPALGLLAAPSAVGDQALRAPWEGVFRPACALPANQRLAWRASGRDFVADVKLPGRSLRWHVRPRDGHFLSIVSVEEQGVELSPMAQSWIFPGEGGTALDRARLEDGRLVLDFVDGTRETLTCLGAALCIDLAAGGVAGHEPRSVSLGGLVTGVGIERIAAVQVAYCDDAAVGVVVLKEAGLRYASARFDPTLSNASDIGSRVPGSLGPDGELRYSQEAKYFPNTRGKVRPLAERVWVAWSDELLDVLPAVQRAPSAWRGQPPRFYFDLATIPFAGARDTLLALPDLGLRDLTVQMHQWQRDGHGKGLPNQIWPPREEWGGLAGLREVSEAAHAADFSFGLYHNWIFNGARIPGASMLQPDGTPIRTADGGQFLKPQVALSLVDEVEGQIHREFGTNTCYTDSLTAGMPTADMDAALDSWGRLLPQLACLKQVLDKLHTIHGGPVGGEGSLGYGNLLWAGLVDHLHGYPTLGCETATAETMGRYADLIPDFKLARLHPLVVHLGMGDHWRYFHPLDDSFHHDYEPEERDQLLGVSTLMGNAGFHWLDAGSVPGDVARDWWAMAEGCARMLACTSGALAVEYQDARGRYVGLSEKLARGESLELGDCRHRVRWPEGLCVWTNMTPVPWALAGEAEGLSSARAGAEPLVLAPWGRWVAQGDFSAGLVQVQGRRVEYSQGATRLYLDGRGEWVERAGLATDGAVGWEQLAVDRWRLYPIFEYQLRRAKDGGLTWVRTRGVRVSPELIGAPADRRATFVLRDVARGGTRAGLERRELAPGQQLEIDVDDMARRGARSLEIQRE